MIPMSARSRRPTIVPCGMASRRRRVSSGVQDGGLADADDVPGALHRAGRVQLQDAAGNQPVETLADARQVLLHRGLGQLQQQLLDVGSHVDRPHLVQLTDALAVTPVQEPGHRAIVGLAGVGVADGRGEEIDEALGGLRSGPQHQGG